jgi:hypothetical protein
VASDVSQALKLCIYYNYSRGLEKKEGGRKGRRRRRRRTGEGRGA